MRSIKTKLFSLGMAASMLLALGGCAMSTPANVGSIGGVEIPAGVYLLAQYNSYNTASGLADLATGETANDVKTVLKAQCTGTINGEEVTTDGADYISQLTSHAIEYYALLKRSSTSWVVCWMMLPPPRPPTLPTACGIPTATCTPPTAFPSPRWRPTC